MTLQSSETDLTWLFLISEPPRPKLTQPLHQTGSLLQVWQVMFSFCHVPSLENHIIWIFNFSIQVNGHVEIQKKRHSTIIIWPSYIATSSFSNWLAFLFSPTKWTCSSSLTSQLRKRMVHDIDAVYCSICFSIFEYRGYLMRHLLKKKHFFFLQSRKQV